MSLHLLRIVTSVIPARFDISTCRIWMPSSTAAKYIYAAASPFGALPSARRWLLVLWAISIASLSTFVLIFAMFTSLAIYWSIAGVNGADDDGDDDCNSGGSGSSGGCLVVVVDVVVNCANAGADDEGEREGEVEGEEVEGGEEVEVDIIVVASARKDCCCSCIKIPISITIFR